MIFAAGRLWDEAKNMTALADAARDIDRPIHVAGSALHPNGEQRPLPGLVTLGVVPHAALRCWYRRAALFVHPAVYVPPRDPAAIAAAVNQLIHDADALAARAQSAQRRARGFSARRMAKTYLDIYHTLLADAAPVRREVMTCAS